MDIPLKQIRNLLKTLEEGGASEFEYEDDKVRLRVTLAKGAAPVTLVTPAGTPAAIAQALPTAAPGGAPAAKDESVDPNLVFVTSPFVGTFYRAPSPEAESFVEIGAAVKKG